MALKVIVKLSDAAGTSITISTMSLDSVIQEFHEAVTEQRLMNVQMNRPEYTHLVNPQQVCFIQTLDY